MSISTNIIQNVYYANGNTACNSGTGYCSEGYALYFPCLKDITRGQDVCFDFYVTDLSTQDVVNLDTVDDITLTLSGQYGCQYGTFSYPDNILSLQKTSQVLKYSCNFDDKVMCQLSLAAVDIEDTDTYLNFKKRDFYSDNKVQVSAFDTPTHIFIGWATFEDEEEGCSDETIEDYIISTDNIYEFIITEDIRLFALYRERKKYDIVVDPENKNSHYNVTYNSITYHLSNRVEEDFNDSYDKVSNVLEGYSVKIECIPNSSTMDSESDNDYSYEFAEWKDGNTDRIRVIKPGSIESSIFETENEIRLYARCFGPVDPYEIESDTTPVLDDFDEEGIHIYTESSDVNEYEYIGDEFTKEIDNVTVKSIEEETYLHINNGKLVISSDIEDGVQINIQAKADEICELLVTVDGLTMSHIINPNDDVDNVKIYYFVKCNESDIEITTCDECLIKNIEIYKVNITDEGKARLCLDADDVIIEGDSDEEDILFEDIPTGPLYASGAIMVDGKSYGLSQVQIGNVNRLNKINII